MEINGKVGEREDRSGMHDIVIIILRAEGDFQKIGYLALQSSTKSNPRVVFEVGEFFWKLQSKNEKPKTARTQKQPVAYFWSILIGLDEVKFPEKSVPTLYQNSIL